MYETYPKGGKTVHKMVDKEEHLSGWKGDSTKTRYPKGALHGAASGYKNKQSGATFAKAGGNAQVSATYPQSGGKNGKSFKTDCNY